ncbi:hypothetical protein RCL1_004822 [Eukaryota sp. TZLM3-RCL]
MYWKKTDTSSRWYDYINRFQNVFARSTLAGVSRGIPASSVRINMEFVKLSLPTSAFFGSMWTDVHKSIPMTPNTFGISLPSWVAITCVGANRRRFPNDPQTRPRKGQAPPHNPPSTPTPSSSTEKEEPA